MSSTLTIRELAARLGVSRTTVSLALRNDPRIKQETRLRVQRLAESLGYRRNALVTTLMTQVQARRVHFNGEVLAYITALNEEFYWQKQSEGEVYLGACKMADQLGFRLEPFWTGSMGVNSHRVARILRARRARHDHPLHATGPSIA
jgi:DNA-binding LacI/PurR family transcriptional regulator